MKTVLRIAALAALAASVAHADRLPPSGARVALDGGHARVPFVVTSQHIWVRGTINDSDSLWIVVDTGAATTMLDESVARNLDRKVKGTHETLGAAGKQASHTVTGGTLRLPGLTIRRDRYESTDLGAFGAASGSHPMQVILGYDLFRDCIVRFDYAGGVMDVWDPGHAPADTGGAVVPMTLQSNHPYIDAEVRVPNRAPIRGRFVIDTGSSGSVALAPEIVAEDSLETAFPRTLEIVSRGVGGEMRSRLGRAETVRVGTLEFREPVAVLSSPGAGRITAPGAAGNLGGGLLQRCRVTFDYARGLVRFEPNERFLDPFPADMSGVAMNRAGAVLVVRLVNSGTPAEEAGLQIGDQVLSVDGVPADRVDVPSLRQRFQREGETVTLEVARGDQHFTARLLLRRLI